MAKSLESSHHMYIYVHEVRVVRRDLFAAEVVYYYRNSSSDVFFIWCTFYFSDLYAYYYLYIFSEFLEYNVTEVKSTSNEKDVT